jgi:tetratricopeptide (TPR) repeat protein
MTELARLPVFDRAPAGGTEARGIPRLQTRYYAFLSYSHRDKELADWLHRELERFRVPHSLAGRLTANGVVPKRLTPIFRDQQELAAAGDLGKEIKAALAASQFLIVLCSPTAAKSRWTNAEVEAFKRTRPDACVLAAIVAGEPFASEMPGREDEECFPPALRQKFDRRGRPTPKRAEPLAADFRDGEEGKRLALLKLVAGMLGVGLDDLVQRETTRRHRQLAWLAAGSLAGMAVTSTLAITAIQSRDEAREQRRQAEGLVGFMLGDLKDKLEPIGRLDALDAVGSRALAYYQHQDKSSLSDAALAQRSKALTLMGEIANTRGDLDGALSRYQEAFATTAELVRRTPDDPQRLWDHAQNVFYIADIDRQRGKLDEAERASREYKRLADQMVALDPGNRKWLLEVKYASSNLGVILLDQRRYAEASVVLQKALATAETLAAAEPANGDYQKSVLETLAWLSQSQFGEGKLDEAIAKRERQIGLINAAAAKNPGDVEYRDTAIAAHRALGRWLASRGSLDEGLRHAAAAVQIAQGLIPTEPSNMHWVEFAANAQLDYASILLVSGRTEEAAAHTRAACDSADRLVSRDSTVVGWRKLMVDCISRKAQLALRSRAYAEALGLAQRALSVSRAIRSDDPVDDQLSVAGGLKLIGDIQSGAGNRQAAMSAWQTALAKWPTKLSESPKQTAIRAELLKDVGRTAEARPLSVRLQSVGYRRIM